MGATYRIDPERRLVHYHYEGVVTRDDIVGVAARAVADPRFEVGFNVLIDVSDIAEISVSSEAVRTLVDAVSQPLDQQGIRWTVAVAAPGDVAFGFARMYEMLRSGSPEEVHVFRSLREACSFLGIDPADLA